jgi:phage anti-repressor protein
VRTAQHWFQPLIPVFGLFQNQRTVGLDEALQNFIYKHTIDLKNVQMNKKKEKGEFTGCQVSSK